MEKPTPQAAEQAKYSPAPKKAKAVEEPAAVPELPTGKVGKAPDKGPGEDVNLKPIPQVTKPKTQHLIRHSSDILFV